MNCSLKIAILHGWGAGAKLLSGLRDRLSGLGHTVTLYEMPGYGSRQGSQQEFEPCQNLRALAEDARRQLPNQDLWIGWSLGSMIALHVASKQPDFLGVLGLCSTAKFIVNDNKRDALQALRESVQRDPAKATLRFQRSMLAAEHRSSIGRQLDPERIAKESLLQGLNILERADLRDELDKIAIPVRLISGLEDPIIPASSGEAVAANIPGSQFSTLPCGHLPFLECPDRLWEQVVEFIETIIESKADRKSV